MSSTHIRPYRAPSDLDAQYDIWLRATEHLPFAWRSNIRNTRAFGAHVAAQPGARLFAERDGAIVGYIGVNCIMEWPGIGKALPFGAPWTWPLDEALEEELYQRMLASLPTVFDGARIDATVQRFRRTWTRLHAALRRRGWIEHDVEPILAKRVACHHLATPRTRRFEAGDEALITGMSDPSGPAIDDKALQRRLEVGWYEPETLFVAPEGAFQFEMRSGRAEVKLSGAADALATMLDELAYRTAEAGAALHYFTLESDQTRRRDELLAHGYDEADADIYVIKRFA